jgi:hypothetical protein
MAESEKCEVHYYLMPDGHCNCSEGARPEPRLKSLAWLIRFEVAGVECERVEIEQWRAEEFVKEANRNVGKYGAHNAAMVPLYPDYTQRVPALPPKEDQ